MRGYWTRPSVALANVADTSDPKADLMALGWELALFADENVTEDTGNLDPGVQVASWSNYAGSPANPHSFAQAVQGSQPTSEIVDGIQALNFDGSSDVLRSTSETWASGTSHTIVVIYRPTAIVDAFFLDAQSGRFIVRMTSASKYQITAGADRTSVEAPITVDTWQWLLMTCDATGAVCKLWHNGTPLTNLAYSPVQFAGSVAIARHVISTTFYFRGQIAAILAQPSVVDAAGLGVIATAINRLYGLSKGSL
jgi:hypothetical protein